MRNRRDRQGEYVPGHWKLGIVSLELCRMALHCAVVLALSLWFVCVLGRLCARAVFFALLAPVLAWIFKINFVWH